MSKGQFWLSWRGRREDFKRRIKQEAMFKPRSLKLRKETAHHDVICTFTLTFLATAQRFEIQRRRFYSKGNLLQRNQ